MENDGVGQEKQFIINGRFKVLYLIDQLEDLPVKVALSSLPAR